MASRTVGVTSSAGKMDQGLPSSQAVAFWRNLGRGESHTAQDIARQMEVLYVRPQPPDIGDEADTTPEGTFAKPVLPSTPKATIDLCNAEVEVGLILIDHSQHCRAKCGIGSDDFRICTAPSKGEDACLETRHFGPNVCRLEFTDGEWGS